MAQVRIEFTVEPFVEGQPGPHVLSAVAAVEDEGLPVDVGPFSSQAVGPSEQAMRAVVELLRAAVANGASRVSLQVEVVG